MTNPVTHATPAPQQLPTDVATLQNMLKSATAQLMAHSQTVNELLKANMDLRAALHMSQMHETPQPVEAPAHAPAVPA